MVSSETFMGGEPDERNATMAQNIKCLQYNQLKPQLLEGSEECLVLNVYVPFQYFNNKRGNLHKIQIKHGTNFTVI